MESKAFLHRRRSYLSAKILTLGLALFVLGRPAHAQADCADAKEQLRTKCCSGDQGLALKPRADVLTFAGMPAGTTEILNVPRCDGTTAPTKCVRKAVALPLPPRVENHQSTQHTADQSPADAACIEGWTQVRALCDPSEVPAKLEHCSEGGSISGLPLCEDLEQLSSLEWCSLWDLAPCYRRHGIEPFNLFSRREHRDPDIALGQFEQQCLSELTTDDAKAKQKDLNPGFISKPQDFPVNFPVPLPIPPGTVDAFQPINVPIGLAERPILGLRLQVPGNFIRYYLEQVALPAGIKKIQDEFTAKHVDASCDPSTLSCSINSVHLFDAPKFIDKHRKVAFGQGFDIPQGLVNAKVERTDEGWDISRLDVNVGPFQVHWWGTVSLISKRPLSFTVRGPKTHLQLLPLHDPKNENTPHEPALLNAADRKARYLDRVWFVHPIPNDTCNRLRTLAYNDGEISQGDKVDELSGKYITSVQPFKCDCPPLGAPPSIFGSNGTNYCLIDPWPREVMVSDFNSGLPDAAALADRMTRIRNEIGPVTEVFCDPDTRRFLTDPASDLGDLSGPIRKSDIWREMSAWAAAHRQNLWNDISTFGCMGRTAPRLASGPEILIPAGDGTSPPNIRIGKEISSGIGFKFDTEVDLGEMQVAISPSPITIDFPLEFKIAKWIEEELPVLGFLGVIIGWIIEFILILISVVLTVLVSITMAVWGPIITGTALFLAVHLSPGTQTLEAQGLISHQPGPPNDTGTGLIIRDDHLQVGVRRIVTTRPNVQSDTWSYQFQAPSCRRLAEGEGGDGFTEVVNFLKNTVLCPFEVVGNLSQAITLPMRNLLLWLTNELIFDVQDAAEQAITAQFVDAVASAEKDSNLATLMTSSLQAIVDTPQFVITDTAVKNAIPPGIPPWIAWGCQLTAIPIAGCTIAQLFGFNGEASVFERGGAMTHYRSLADYGVKTPFELFRDIERGFSSKRRAYPPVRYCVGGDVPRPELQDYREDDGAALLKKLTTLEEFHYSTPGGPSTDWRNQCAAFVDTKVKTHWFTRFPNPAASPLAPDTFEFVVVPSVRTNFLLNEVFFCPTEQSCNFGIPIDSIRNCLINGNCNLEQQFQTAFLNTPFNKAMPPMALRAELAVCSMASDIWYRVIPAAQVPATSTVPLENVLSKGPNVLDALTSIVDRTCPLNANCAAQKQSLIDFHAKWIPPCSDLLQFFGLYDPTHTMNIGDVPGDLL